MHVWFVPPSRFAFLSARKSCTCQLTPNVVYSCLDTVRFCCFPHENVCQPSSLQSKVRSIRTRQSRLQTVIDGKESRRALDKMSKLHRSRLDMSFCTRRSGSSQLASDETLSRTACPGTELHCKPTDGAWISCARCALRPHYFPKHTARMTSVSTPSSASEQEALKRMSLLGDNDFTQKAVRDTIAEGSLERRRLHHNQRSCTTQCTFLERHPVRRSDRELQCTEKFRRNHHLDPPR